MESFEPLLTAREISKATGHTVSEGFVRQAFHRDAEHHPCPCVRFGGARPILKTRLSVFDAWLEEEMSRA